MENPSAAGGEVAARLTANAVQCLPAGGLQELLRTAERESRQLRVKLGIDPTAPDIHLGHVVVLAKLREFQDLGHRVVLIVGDYTARVGDPSGRSSTRPVLGPEEIERNARTYQEQALHILDDDPDRLEIRRNSEWLDMPMSDLLTLVQTTTVARVLERDDFAKRTAAGAPISLLELLYPILQGYDSVMVAADVELGGTDQTFNLLLARDIQRAYGQPEQVVLTMPLLVGVDGEQKMSKSLGNQIGITDPPEDVYGRTMSIPDGALGDWWRLLLGRPAPVDLPPRDSKRALARGLVQRLDGDEDAARAEAHFDRVIVAHEAPAEVEELAIAAADGTVHLPAAIAQAFSLSRSEARRLIDQGGVALDGDIVPPGEHDLAVGAVDGAVLRVGRRRYRRLRVQQG